MSQRPLDVPENANEGCVGPSSEMAGKASGCEGCPNQASCASGAGRKPDPAIEFVVDRMEQVKHKILVLSGKGGVGKSTVSAQLAFALAAQGKQVGLLDVDICGPSIPRMLGLLGQEVHQSASGWSPVYVNDNLGVMSIGFMLPSNDDAIIWRGPRKNGLIKQFLTDVDWGELDYLIIDTPPGTSDEHISIVQYLRAASLDGAVVVTTPQEIAMMDVRKELNFCHKTGIRVLGVLENMGAYKSPFSSLKLLSADGADVTAEMQQKIQELLPELWTSMVEGSLFDPYQGGPAAMAEKFRVPYLGCLPLDSNLFRACEEGTAFVTAYPSSPAIAAFQTFVDSVVQSCSENA